MSPVRYELGFYIPEMVRVSRYRPIGPGLDALQCLIF
jgi:hypothetical protein